MFNCFSGRFLASAPPSRAAHHRHPKCGVLNGEYPLSVSFTPKLNASSLCTFGTKRVSTMYDDNPVHVLGGSQVRISVLPWHSLFMTTTTVFPVQNHVRTWTLSPRAPKKPLKLKKGPPTKHQCHWYIHCRHFVVGSYPGADHLCIRLIRLSDQARHSTASPEKLVHKLGSMSFFLLPAILAPTLLLQPDITAPTPPPR
jgi:hypothetical protein